MIRLSNATLGDLPDSIPRPTYDRSSLTAGIVHIGVGNFHRAHQAWYTHQLMQAGAAREWAIVGSGVQPYDATQRVKLLRQDLLSTLIKLSESSTAAQVVGSMTDYLPVEPDNAALVRKLADPAIRIVSLTVTEGGYYVDPVTKRFDAGHQDIRHDTANPEHPRTAFGAMVAALRMRRDQGSGPFTGLSCDNLQGNGAVLRQTVVSLARQRDPELADWIESNCTFPNSMVDCIVPATGTKELAMVKSHGIDDQVPVTHEGYRQWVIEDDFCRGRPDWDAAGATFSNRVQDYMEMKIRVLNAGHQIVANAGEILSIETIVECMAHPLIHALFRKVQRDEILPQIAPVANVSKQDYLDLIDARFSNPAIFDTARRVSYEGSARHTGFILPILRERVADGAPVEGLALVEALWARMCEGTREDGSAIEPNDPLWHTLTSTAKAARNRPRAWLEQRLFYGDLAEAPGLADAFERWLDMIWSKGCETALQTYAAN